LLFLFLLAVLDIFTHPASVMYGHYVPLVIRLSDFYWHTPVLATALLGVPFVLIAILLLAQWGQFGLRCSAAFVVVPFTVALLLQYFIAVQLDKYLVDFPGAIPWHYVFQLPFIVGCLEILVVYLVITAMLWLVVLGARRVIAFALTRRCSQPLAGA